MNRRRALYFTSLAAAGALALGACGNAASDPAPTETVTVGPTATAPSPAPTYTPPTDYQSPPPAGPAVLKLGETYTGPNGIQITVEDAGAAVQSSDGTPYSMYKTTLTNTGTTPWDPSGVWATVNYGAAGTSATPVYDYANPDLGDNYFDGILLPDGTQTQLAGYTVPPGEPVVITVSAGWDLSKAVVFTN